MYVRLPLGLKLPGLTVDKYARRKVTQDHYEKCEWGLYDHVGGNGTRRFNMAAFNRTMESLASAAREMAAYDQEHQAPCEQPIMMWNHVTDLAREMLSEHPSKKQIEQFRHRCADLYDPRFPRSSSIDHDARREIDKIVYDLDTVLQQWDLTEAFPLRFYPYKPDRFDRYSI